MWNDLEYGFQVAFELAWEAYKAGTFPVGACILDTDGRIAATGRNQVDSGGEGILSHHELAHAELNALLAISGDAARKSHPRIKEYTLFVTLEPCPLCFGAVVMSSIRRVRYAAADSFAGAASLNDQLDYIKMKAITVEGPAPGAEVAAIAMQVCFSLETYAKTPYLEKILEHWTQDSTQGVKIGQELAENGSLVQAAASGRAAAWVYDTIIASIGGALDE